MRRGPSLCGAAPYCFSRYAIVDHISSSWTEMALIFRNGSVFTGTHQPPIAADVAVRDGRIAAIGPAVSIPGAEAVDMRGRLLMPGFQDAHAHPINGGLTRRRCDVLSVSGAGAVLAAVAA
jgi:predicted amidohydrolase YtcJ